MIKSNVWTWSLNFLDRSLETGFIESKIPYQNSAFKIVILEAVLLVFVSWFLNPYNKPVYEGVVLLVGLGLAIITVAAVAFVKYSKKHVENLILVLIVCYVMGLLESSKKNNMEWESSTFFQAGAMIEIILATPILAKISWKKSALLFILINILCCLRYTDFSTNFRTRYHPLIHFVGNALILGVCAFVSEKNDRLSFYKIKVYERSLSSFKELMKDVLPNPIVIAIEDKILFQNEEALREFRLDCYASPLEAFKDLTLENENTAPREPIQKFVFDGAEGSRRNTLLDLLRSRSGKNSGHLTQYLGFLRKNNRDERTYDIKVKETIWEGKTALMVAFSENQAIMKLKLLNEQATYKDSLISTISHELKTPVYGIVGMIDLCLESCKEKEVIEKLRVAKISSNLLLYFIYNILDFTQGRSGQLRLNLGSFSVWNAIKEISDLVRFQAERKGLGLILENKLAQKREPVIRNDEIRFKQVLLNLVGNALKFTQAGSIQVTLEESSQPISLSLPSSRLRECLTVRVADTGTGIKPEDQQKLFGLFGNHDTNGTLERKVTGVGLGLAISQTLVRLLSKNLEGCEIKAVSEFGKGSCFYFTIFSFEDQEQKGQAAREERGDLSGQEKGDGNGEGKEEEVLEPAVLEEGRIPHSPVLKHLPRPICASAATRILIVDDDQINIYVASSFLKNKQNYLLHVAGDGSEAINKILEKAREGFFYSIILMDCNMPVMDGFKATTLIRDLVRNKQIPNLRIIACTANISESDYKLCFSSGMDDYLAKPFTRDALISKIEANLEKIQAL